MLVSNRIIMSMLIILFFVSCSSNRQKIKDDGEFVSRYYSENFCELRDFYIAERDRTLTKVFYIVGESTFDKPPYFVEYSLVRNSILTIDRNMLAKNGVSDYFTSNEIEEMINTIRKYKFYLLEIDTLGTVLINPYNSNSPPYFLRLPIESNLTNIMFKYKYTKFSGRWFIKE